LYPDPGGAAPGSTLARLRFDGSAGSETLTIGMKKLARARGPSELRFVISHQ
jgi:hypothetical protein